MAIKYVCSKCGATTTVNEPNGFVSGVSDNSILKTVILDMTGENINAEESANNTKEIKGMVNAKYNERMAKLAEAGFNVEAMNSMFGDKGMEMFLDNFSKDDPVVQEIIENGYVRNSKLHRRYITAQFYRLYEDGNWTDNYNLQYSYEYQFKMLLEELRILAILEKEDKEAFEERVCFFNKDVAVSLIRDYHMKWTKHLLGIKPTKFKKYGDSIKINYSLGNKGWIRVNEIYSTTAPVLAYANAVLNCTTYQEVHKVFNDFVSSPYYSKLRYSTQKCAEFTDAFKGSGAYYSLKNMFMFNGLHGFTRDGKPLGYQESLDDLYKRREEYKGYGWRMLGYFKQVNELNNFSWSTFVDNGYKN